MGRLIPSLDLELNLRLGRRALRVVTLRQVEPEPETAVEETTTGQVTLQVGHDDEHVLVCVEAAGGPRDGERTIVALGADAVAHLIDRLVAHAAEL